MIVIRNYKGKFKLRTHLTALLIILLPLLAAGQTLDFSEISLGELAPNSGLLSQCSWIDFDNDGDLDIYYGIGTLENGTVYHGEITTAVVFIYLVPDHKVHIAVAIIIRPEIACRIDCPNNNFGKDI